MLHHLDSVSLFNVIALLFPCAIPLLSPLSKAVVPNTGATRHKWSLGTRNVDIQTKMRWRPLRALLGPQGSASSGRGGVVRTTGQGTGTAWSREPRSPPSVGTTWRSQKGLAFGLKALTAPPLC